MLKFLGRLILKHPFVFALGTTFAVCKLRQLKQKEPNLGPRSIALKKYAQKNGFGFAEHDFSLYRSEFAKLAFFMRTSGRLFTNILSKPDILIFDFAYPQNKKGNISLQTVMVISSEKAKQISFTLYPAGFFRKFVLSGKSMEIFENKTFADNFRLIKENITDERIKQIINPKVQQFFSDNPSWTVIVSGGCVSLTRENKLIYPQAIDEFLASAFEIVTLMELV